MEKTIFGEVNEDGTVDQFKIPIVMNDDGNSIIQNLKGKKFNKKMQYAIIGLNIGGGDI